MTQGRTELQLPPELLTAILVDNAPIGSRNHLKPLLLVSHQFYDIIAPIFYESLLITVEDAYGPLITPESWTSLFHSHLPTLHRTFSSKPMLASYTKILVSHYDLYAQATYIDCTTTQLIFPSLVNLQRLSISPSEVCFHALLPSLPNVKLLTHLELHHIWSPQIAASIIHTGTSLGFLSLPRDDDPLPNVTSSNVRTIQVYQEHLHLITPDRFPRLEHLEVRDSGLLQRGLDSAVCGRLRTLSLACTTGDLVLPILKNLKAVEYLNTVFFDFRRGDDFQLPSLLSIPSKRIKYIRMVGIKLNNTIVVQRLFDKHPSLVMIDIAEDARPRDHFTSYHRYFRGSANENEGALLPGEGGGGEGHGFERLAVLRIPSPPVFRMWWEVAKVKDDVEDARANGLEYLSRYRARLAKKG
ncbi:hypothetical protein ONZ45_g15489 [Pleurotus djamor]|nr:hypothetical protein ONZ45_g15489 [Pleurotus djamor]